MSLKSSASDVKILMSSLMFGESPRWREGRFWVSDWVAHEIIAVDLDGQHEVVVREPSIPLCMDLPAGWTHGRHERPAHPAPGTRRRAGGPCRSEQPFGTRLERDRRGWPWQRIRQRRGGST